MDDKPNPYPKPYSGGLSWNVARLDHQTGSERASCLDGNRGPEATGATGVILCQSE